MGCRGNLRQFYFVQVICLTKKHFVWLFSVRMVPNEISITVKTFALI